MQWPKIEILSTSNWPQERNHDILGIYGPWKDVKREECTCRLGFATIVKVLLDGQTHNLGKKNKRLYTVPKGNEREKMAEQPQYPFCRQHIFLMFWYSIPSCFLTQPSLESYTYSLNSLTVETTLRAKTIFESVFSIFFAYFPFFPSQSLTDLSKEALATSLVSGENRTSLMSCWCPVILVTGFFSSSGCHRYKVKSSEPDTSLSAPVPYKLDIGYLMKFFFHKGRNLKDHGVAIYTHYTNWNIDYFNKCSIEC